MKIISKENIDSVEQEEEPLVVSDKPKSIRHIEQFILNNPRLINGLISLKFPVLLMKYCEVNPVCSRYMMELSTALIAVSSKVAEIEVCHVNDRENRWNINFDKLIKILQDPQEAEDLCLLSCLTDGMLTWQLPMISNLYRWSDNKSNNTEVLEALLFLEKNRQFIKDCLHKKVGLLKWLESPVNKKYRLILQDFTDELFGLFNQEKRRNGLPVIMDVRRLWQALHKSMYKATSDIDDSEANSRQLRYKTAEKLWSIEDYQQFMSVGPCPLTCFLDALVGVESLDRNHQILQVSSDVLMWLMLTHCDNKMISSCIMAHAQVVDRVVTAYNDHQIRPQAHLLSLTWVSFLNDASNVCAKLNDKETEVLSDLNKENFSVQRI